MTTAHSLVATALCAASIAAVAQAAQGQTPASAGRRFVVIGCLSRSASAAKPQAGKPSSPAMFTITDTRGDKPTTYRVEGDPATLNLHAGHLVEVAGSLAAGTGPPAGMLTMKVSSLVYIAKTCPKTP